MPTIKILIDHLFPYGDEALDHPDFSVRRVAFPKFLPRPLRHYYHALDLYRQSFEADVIVGNRRTVLLLGLLFLFYKPPRISLIGYEIIFNFKDNLKNKAVVLLWKQAVRKIDRMIVHTQGEVAYLAQKFATSENKFAFIPFYTEEEAYIGPSSNGYVFLAGRMERDFITLCLPRALASLLSGSFSSKLPRNYQGYLPTKAPCEEQPCRRRYQTGLVSAFCWQSS